MNTEDPYYDLYVAETKAHNACALREQALLKDVEFAGREMERLREAVAAADALMKFATTWHRSRKQDDAVERWEAAFSSLSNTQV